jgi:hypothetical protein
LKAALSRLFFHSTCEDGLVRLYEYILDIDDAHTVTILAVRH